jgi:hypothetical protein
MPFRGAFVRGAGKPASLHKLGGDRKAEATKRRFGCLLVLLRGATGDADRTDDPTVFDHGITTADRYKPRAMGKLRNKWVRKNRRPCVGGQSKGCGSPRLVDCNVRRQERAGVGALKGFEISRRIRNCDRHFKSDLLRGCAGYLDQLVRCFDGDGVGLGRFRYNFSATEKWVQSQS